MSIEHQMFWIRNKKYLKNELVESHITEYEVIADAHIVGGVTYGPYYFTIWEIGHKTEGELRRLCLRIQEKSFDENEKPWETANKSGFYHGGGIASELVALASLFLRRRLKLGPIVRMGDEPRMIVPSSGRIDNDLFTGSSNLGELNEWLPLVENLRADCHQAFILAVKLYQQAIGIIEDWPDIAYLNLVSSIEVLCQDFEIERIPLSRLDVKLASLVSQISDTCLRGKIEDSILARERFIGQKFENFIIAHTDKSFWEYSARPKLGRINPSDLRELLKRIYHQRSRTLHTGEPFYPSVSYCPPQGAEIDFSLGMTIGKRKWEPGDFIPYPHFFERLVNHVLKDYLKKNQAQSLSDC